MTDKDYQYWSSFSENKGKSYKEYLKAEPPFKSEKALEQFFCKRVRKWGAIVIKGDCHNMIGIPDRIVFYDGVVALAELKMPKGRVSPVQAAVHKKFKAINIKTYIIRSRRDIDNFIDEMFSHFRLGEPPITI